MAVFVLIHGAWHGKWCWKYIIPLIENLGYKVIAEDLPGLGEDQTPIENITLDTYVNSIINIINDQNEKVILVGHSMGGIIMSEVAEKIPHKIKCLVYLCAFMLENGESLIDIVKNNPNPFLQLEFAKDFSYSIVKEEAASIAFFNECNQEDIDFAKDLLRSQPDKIFQTPINITEENYGKVPKIYIECIKDNAISIKLQRSMIQNQSIVKVYSIDTDHSPFFSTPNLFCNILNEISALF